MGDLFHLVDNGSEKSDASLEEESNAQNTHVFDSDTMGLDMLINPNYNSGNYNSNTCPINDDDESDGKTNIFASSEEEEGSDEEIIEKPKRAPQFSHTFKPVSYMESNINEEDINRQKTELLYQFDRLEKKGVKLPRQFTIESSLDDMKSTFERIKRDRERDTAVRTSGKWLVAAATGLEFMNNKFDPFDINLNGWSESVHESINDYDEIFEELNDKYHGPSKFPPEIRLMGSLAASAFFFHASNAMFKTATPDMNDVLNDNPDLKRQFAEASARKMGSQMPMGGMGSFFSSMLGGGVPMAAPPAPSGRMSGPSDLDNILANLESKNDIKDNISTATPSEISEMTDTNSIRNLMGRTRKNKNKKSINI
jgi:hypothetical protein